MAVGLEQLFNELESGNNSDKFAEINGATG